MKIKSDHITNSSSSSFVVAVAPFEGRPNELAEKYLNRLLASLFSNWNKFETETEVSKLLEEIYSYMDDEEKFNQKVEDFKVLHAGKTIYQKDIDNYSEDMLDLINGLAKDGFIEILHRDY